MESIESLAVTRIVIAHRLSTIRKANRIYVLQAGRVVQQGGFDELLEAEGLFRRPDAPPNGLIGPARPPYLRRCLTRRLIAPKESP